MQIHRHHGYDAPHQRYSMVLPTDSPHRQRICRHTPDANRPLPADNRHIHPLYRDIPRRDAPNSSGRQSSGNRRRILRTAGSVAAAHWPRQRSNNMPPHPPGSQQHRMARRHRPAPYTQNHRTAV